MTDIYNRAFKTGVLQRRGPEQIIPVVLSRAAFERRGLYVDGEPGMCSQDEDATPLLIRHDFWLSF